MTTSTTTKTIRVRTSEGVVLVPTKKRAHRIESLESDFGDVVGFEYVRGQMCSDCWAKNARSWSQAWGDGWATEWVPLTTDSGDDYFRYCDDCNHKLDLRYTRNASDGERRSRCSRSSWTDP